MKFIIVSGGVISGLGKGITTSSIALLLQSCGIKVTPVKCDMYLNIDAGTMNPLEHGEVFVTHDGVETDQDLGHYERFLSKSLSRKNYLTNGQLYFNVLQKERSLKYKGVSVQPYHHIPPEIISFWLNAGRANRSQVVIIEMGGTAGEYEGLLFFEAARRLKLKYPKDTIFIHVGYLPAPFSIGELKSKPLQQSVSILHSLGIQPDFIIARAEKPVDRKRKEKIALVSGLSLNYILSNPDVQNTYEVPLILDKQSLTTNIINKLNLLPNKKDLISWKRMVHQAKNTKYKLTIGIIGKYHKTGDYTLEDTYVSVVESLKHASWFKNAHSKLVWIESERVEKMNDSDVNDAFAQMQGMIVPQGWGRRGVEGKIKAVKYARTNKIPYLGLCFGMQMASIEFGRHVVGLKNANSTEVDPKTPDPVIHIMPNQAGYLAKKQYGGTIRLGAWPCLLVNGTRVEKAYRKFGRGANLPWNQPGKSSASSKKWLVIFERHRHRYEFNNKYKDQFERAGFVISGISPDGKLVEAIELSDHPFFVGTQYHPEYLSRPLTPHPLFISFIEAVLKKL